MPGELLTLAFGTDQVLEIHCKKIENLPMPGDGNDFSCREPSKNYLLPGINGGGCLRLPPLGERL